MIATILAVGGLAFLDSLNPFSIAAMAIVISKTPSLPRGLVFIVGTFLAYHLGGVLILNGWAAALKSLVPLITPQITVVGWTVSALAAMGGAIYLWTKASRAATKSPAPDSPAALMGIFGFALMSTASDLPTAIPFFGAAPLILATKPSVLGVVAWLGFYCLVYVGPLLLLLCLKLFGGARLEPLLLKINKAMDWLTGRLTPPLLIILGVWCIWKAFAN